MNENLGEQFEDIEQRRDKGRRHFFARQPKRIDNVIAQVVQRRGYAQVRIAGQRDEAWRTTAGEFASATQVGTMRRGTLEILVGNSLMMQELTFRKEELLTKLQSVLPDAGIKQLRFRLAQIV